MIGRSLIFLSLICLVERSSAQTSCVDSSSIFKFNSIYSIGDNAIPAANNGTILVSANKEAAQNFATIISVIKLDKFNNVLFSKTISSFIRIADYKVIECNNGDIVLAIVDQETPQKVRTPYVIRLGANGSIVWQKQLSPIVYSATTGHISYIELAENSSNDLLIGTTNVIEADPDLESITGYYYIYKLTGSGNITWKASLIQPALAPYINAISEKESVVSIITQQYTSSSSGICSSTNKKSIGTINLNGGTGAYLSSKNYCLNFSGPDCVANWDFQKNSVKVLPDGSSVITGGISICDNNEPQTKFTISMSSDFTVIRADRYRYFDAPLTAGGSMYVNQFGESVLTAYPPNGTGYLYAVIDFDGKIKMQRKTDYLLGTPIFNDPDEYKYISSYVLSGQNILQITEVHGNISESANCLGSIDTNFLTKTPHTIVPVTFSWDNIITEYPILVNSSFTQTDFILQRTEDCHSVSICDSLEISGVAALCLTGAAQTFTATRNPGCKKLPQWKIDPAAIDYIQTVNDTTISIQFKKAWEGYLYAYSNACGSLLDSFYIKVISSSLIIDLGNDTTFCSPVTLNAGSGFAGYLWQDGSTDQHFNVSSEGTYYVTATDVCGNSSSDTIRFAAKVANLFIGNDTCVQFPHTVIADLGFKNYLWKNGSTNSQFTATTAGTFSVRATNACDETFTDTIILSKRITTFSLGADTVICSGRPIDLSAPAGFSQYQWQDGSTSNKFTVTEAGQYYVTVSDECDNSFSDTISITALQLHFSAGIDTLICKKERTALQATAGYINYSWQPDYKISNTNTAMVWVEPEISTRYIVNAENNNGCSVADSVVVQVKDCPEYLYMPSAFTPNKDGKNDLFKPSVSGALETYELVIYNRWGQLVFKTTDHRKGWDGSLKGLRQNNAMFVWMCRYKFYNQAATMKKGTVLLVY